MMIKTTGKQKKIIEIVWFCCLVLNIVVALWGNVKIGKTDAYYSARVITLTIIPVLMALKIAFLDNNTKKEVLFYAILLILICISYRISGERKFFAISAMVLGSKYIPIRKICKTYFVTGVVAALGVCMLLWKGIVLDLVSIRYQISGYDIYRHSFGLAHPNTVGLWCLIILCAYIAYYEGALRAVSSIIICALTATLFFFTCSRTSTITILFVLISCIIIEKKETFFIKNKKRIARIAASIIVVILVAYSVLTLLYSETNTLLMWINKAFSNRLYYSQMFLNKYGISILGQHIGGAVNTEYPLDSLYTFAPIFLGIIVTVIWIGIMSVGIYRTVMTNNWRLAVICVAFALYSIMEKNMLFAHNFALFVSVACVRANTEDSGFKQVEREYEK